MEVRHSELLVVQVVAEALGSVGSVEVLLKQVVASNWSRQSSDYRNKVCHSLGLIIVPNPRAVVVGHSSVVLLHLVLVMGRGCLKEPRPDQEELHILVHMVNIVDHLCHLEQAHKLLEEVPHILEEGCHNQEEDSHNLEEDCHIQVVPHTLEVVPHTLEVLHILEVVHRTQAVRHPAGGAPYPGGGAP